ncbi:stalk domain-containing protein [Paenibacillus sedimenti]|uniref:Copper amine oxidase-like N-terminal domain-containing protein n=1 Tax=Paenibacillus sedimenti TaxID=2770274 RepID=A0A926KP18_9BACL|nr:stalk domain-containing protein [Paenibacillus sedimenti]MBD0381270.1 hypothetical protein [Paenibacillus sedimenti]
MKKLTKTLIATSVLSLTFAAGVYAASSDIKLFINGKQINTDLQVVDGSSYVPLRVVSESLGADVKWDEAARSISINSKSNSTPPSISTAGLPSSVTNKDITITLNKVVQDSDSLKLYVTYSNNSNDKVMTGDSLVKVVSKGKQYEYSSDFNFDRFYKKPVDKAPDFIEPTVSANSVIFLEPIDGVDTINVVLNANFQEFRFSNVKVN